MPSNKEWRLDNTINRRNMRVWAILKNYVPTYAKHMFEDNKVIEAFYRSENGGINPLDMPICKVCNKPGVAVEDSAFNKIPVTVDPVTGEVLDRLNCYCDLHGITYNTKDLRRYLIEDLNLNPEIIFKIEMALIGEMYK